jgi:hypothetical protein
MGDGALSRYPSVDGRICAHGDTQLSIFMGRLNGGEGLLDENLFISLHNKSSGSLSTLLLLLLSVLVLLLLKKSFSRTCNSALNSATLTRGLCWTTSSVLSERDMW